MSLGATLGIVVAALRTAGVPFMIAGSIASTLHGEPRATQDVDIVVDPLTPEALDRFATSLEPARFYVGDHRAAFSVRGMFNVIDKTNGWKIDLILRRDRPFSVAEFERRQPATIEGVDVDIATAEDVVLSKLEWARHGESERQRSDARAVLAASSDSVDQPASRRRLTNTQVGCKHSGGRTRLLNLRVHTSPCSSRTRSDEHASKALDRV